MAKQPKQASPASAEQPTATPVHPLLRHATQVDAIAEKIRARHAHKEFQIEELEQWKKCVNNLAASPNGKMMLRAMMDESGCLKSPPISDPQRMIVQGIKGHFYLTWVRPYLETEVRKELEP